MTKILQDISIYDINTHTPYPTLAYILQQTGEDIQLNVGGTQTKAKAIVRQITDTCYNILKDSKDTIETINILEYKIAVDETYRRAFLEYVATAVFVTYNFGADWLFDESDKKGLNRLPIMVKTKVSASVLNVGTFPPFNYNYRVGY